MRHWTCGCRKIEWFGSDAPKECQGCPDCGTNAYGRKPTEHEPTTEETIRDGVLVSKKTYCKVCYSRLPGEDDV